MIRLRMFLIALGWLLIWWCSQMMPNTCVVVADQFPVVWPTSVGGNDHAYLLVEGSVMFAQALEEAPSYHWTGAGSGYLATITSASEQDFIHNYIDSIASAGINTYWIGGQRTSPSDWFWINGPEEGIQFWNSTFQNLTYHCCCLVSFCVWGYRPGLGWEPNDQGGVEDSLVVILHVGAYDTPLPWNDAAGYLSYQGYLVEFGGYPLGSAAITNLSTIDFGVEFPTGSPAHQLSPSLGASRFVRFDFVRISELDGSSGSVVRSLAIDRMEFLGRLAFQNDTVSFFSPLGFPSPLLQNSSLIFSFVRSFGGNATNYNISSLQQLEEAFSRGQTLKWSMEIQGWPFAQPTNLLRVDLNISSSSSSGGGQLLLSNTSFPNVGDQLLTVQDGNFGVFLAILDELTIDGGNLTTMPKDPVLVGGQLQIFLPSFRRRLFLDPTLAILVQPEGDGGSDDTPLIVGLTVGLAGGLLMAIVLGGIVAAAVAVGLNWWRRRGIVEKAVNWEGKTGVAADTL